VRIPAAHIETDLELEWKTRGDGQVDQITAVALTTTASAKKVMSGVILPIVVIHIVAVTTVVTIGDSMIGMAVEMTRDMVHVISVMIGRVTGVLHGMPIDVATKINGGQVTTRDGEAVGTTAETIEEEKRIGVVQRTHGNGETRIGNNASKSRGARKSKQTGKGTRKSGSELSNVQRLKCEKASNCYLLYKLITSPRLKQV